MPYRQVSVSSFSSPETGQKCEQILQLAVAEQTSVGRRHQRAVLAQDGSHVVFLKRVVAPGKIHQLRRKVVESSFDAGDRLAVASHYCDGGVTGSDIGVRSNHRFPKIGEAALPARSRQVRA